MTDDTRVKYVRAPESLEELKAYCIRYGEQIKVRLYLGEGRGYETHRLSDLSIADQKVQIDIWWSEQRFPVRVIAIENKDA